MRWLILASGHDTSAHLAGEFFRRRGRQAEVLVTQRLEGADVRWRHRVGAAGADVEVVLADGRHLGSGDFSAVLNRAMLPPLTVMARAAWEDSAYALSEQTAFALSWVNALAPNVVNPPTPRGLAGAWRSPLEWRHQRRVTENRLALRFDGGGPSGVLECGDAAVRLDSVTGAYLRLMDDQRLPEVADEPPASPLRQRARAFHELLVHWLRSPLPRW